MKIIVHRGTHQIGGCATEIKTDTNRIIIDAGTELNSNSNLSIMGVTEGVSDCDAVLYTHFHSDHIGLMDQINEDIPQYISKLSIEILKLEKRVHHPNIHYVLDDMKPYETKETLTFGNIKVTPFMVDHSAFDSHMFLIEADGKRILHTGDFRTHGFRGKGLFPTLEKYVGSVDVLICEGTNLNRQEATSMTEWELSQKARHLLEENKYVFVACSSTNIDRFAAIASAVPYGKYCVCGWYHKRLLDAVSKHSGKYTRLYQFPKMLTYRDNLLKKMEKRGFCMFITLGSYSSNLMLEQFKDKDPLIIYSMWWGYLDDERLKNAVSGYRLEMLHTSGHADIETIRKVADIVSPDMIIPIHTEKPDALSTSFPKTYVANDGEEIII